MEKCFKDFLNDAIKICIAATWNDKRVVHLNDGSWTTWNVKNVILGFNTLI